MNFFTDLVANGIFSIANAASEFWRNLGYANLTFWQVGLDITIVAILLYYIFSLLKGSRSVSILLGLAIIIIVYFISRSLNLITLAWILDKFFMILLFAIPVIFQQELRMALEKLGNTPFSGSEKVVAMDAMITQMVEACDSLACKKDGALIVLQNKIPLKEYIENGLRMDADFSEELLISIFHGKGPLHDGAVIIKDQKIVAAKCILPTSFDSKDRNLGTRHKAAIGLTDHTDASVIVISEERGIISFAKNGDLEKGISLERLQQLLQIVLLTGKKKKKNSVLKYKEE